jgi:hypothetical protein
MLSLGLLEAVAPLLSSTDLERRHLATVFVASVCHVSEGATATSKLRCLPSLVRSVKTEAEKTADAAMRALANSVRHGTVFSCAFIFCSSLLLRCSFGILKKQAKSIKHGD